MGNLNSIVSKITHKENTKIGKKADIFIFFASKMCKRQKTPFDIDTSSRVKLASPKVIITLSISYNIDASTTFDELSYHQRKYRQLQRNQRPSKAFTNSPSGIHGLNRLHKLSNNRYHETRIKKHLALIFHSHRCSSKDKGSVKKFGTV